MNTEAIVWTAPGQVDVTTVELPTPTGSQVVIDVAYSLVSPGTEREWLASDQSHVVLGTTFPFVPGYSLAGIVVDAGPDVTHVRVGDRAVGSPLYGAHAARAVVDADVVTPVPDGVSMEQAVFFNLGMTAAHTVWLSDARLGDSITIVGQGPIGALAAQIAAAAGMNPTVALEIDPDRRAAALAQGVTHAVDPTDEQSFANLLATTGGGTDVAIDLSGSLNGLSTAIRATAPLGTVVLSTGMNAPLEIPYGEVFIKGLILKGGFVNARKAQTKRDTITFLQLVAAGAVKTPDLDGGLYSPTAAPKVYDRVLAADRSLVAPVFDWQDR